MNLHFDIQDYKKAFKKFRELKKKDDTTCLVLSTHTYTEGYWIENNAKPNNTDIIYTDIQEVTNLERRIDRGKKLIEEAHYTYDSKNSIVA